jgi:AcrR family transcriptional regulator
VQHLKLGTFQLAKRVNPTEYGNHDADKTRSNILDVATQEFAEKGLAGARVDEIAEKTNSSKRMIYYYFGGKDELYRAVLERCYANIREQDEESNIDTLSADDALAAHVGLTFDYQFNHPEFVRLVMNENIHHGEHIIHINGIKERNHMVISSLQAILNKGVSSGQFRDGIDAIDLHMSISALAFFNVSNRYTFSAIFDRDVSTPKAVKKRRKQVVDMILDSVRKH